MPTPKPLQNYAWVVAAVGGLILIGSGLAYALNPNLASEAQLGMACGVVLLLLAALLRPDTIRPFLTGRTVRYASHATVTSILFGLILVLVYWVSLQHNQEYDLSETGMFTLSPQTIQLLEGLDQPVQVIGFFQMGDARRNRAEDYLKRYRRYTDKLTYEFHDPNVEPALAQSFALSDYGLVFVSGSRQQETAQVDEQSITGALVRVTSGETKRLYFITGHGEHSIYDSQAEGYSTIRQALENGNYLLDTLNLASSPAIPQEATILVLAGADRPLSPTEGQLLTGWVASGGKLLALVDPMEPAVLDSLFQQYGLLLHDDFVVEDYNNSLVTLGTAGLTPQVVAPLIVQYPFHEITRGLNGYQSFYPFARSIGIESPEQENRVVSPILTTSSGSWGETDLEQTAQPHYNAGQDRSGPLHIGAAAEDYETGTRLVLIGNAGFITNQNVSPEMANMDLFLNAVDWLAEEEELISIRPKPPANRRLFLTSFQVTITLLTSLILIPLSVLAAGLGVWWQRR